MRLISVQIGKSEPIIASGRQVLSGIRKKPVTTPVEVLELGLKGDEQADLSVHGGLSKAVYAYPSEHYEYWNHQAEENGVPVPLQYGHLGENLTLSGLLETEVYVGDVIRFSNCVLCVTEPRLPCFKFNAVMNDKKASKKMVKTGYCGFYLSVVETGTIEPGESFELVPGNRETSIDEMFRAKLLTLKNSKKPE